MKAYKHFCIFLSTLLILGGCKREINNVFLEGGTAPVLKASASGVIPLSFATKEMQAINFSWTNPEYRFTTGVSSQDVTYYIETDTVGSNFSHSNKIQVPKELEKSFTQDQLNSAIANGLGLEIGVSHQIEVRIIATLAYNTAPLISNTVKFSAIPYSPPPKVTPPSTGKLFITGSATPASWMNGGDPELASQKFTQVSSTMYVLNSIALTGGGSYLLIPQYGDWSAKYGGLGANNTNNVDGDDFKSGGGDLLAPTASGNYKIEVDFQKGKFIVTKL